MIIGNGLMANLFEDSDRENVIFFASGVSNSLETDREKFRREEDLLRKTISDNPDKLLVYFSTCSIYDSSKKQSAYVKHKIRMEVLVEELSSNYLILRVSNAVGKGGNMHLLLNYITEQVRRNLPITLHLSASRNLIDIEDVKAITLQLLDDGKRNTTINVASPHHYSILDIVSKIEKIWEREIAIKPIEMGQGYTIHIPTVEDYFVQHRKMYKKKYLMQMLEKYYL